MVFTLLFVSIAAPAAFSQSGNLLTNPGFEQPFEPVANHAPSMVAQGWTPWFSSTEPNTTPEYYPASDTTNGMSAPRIHSGSDAQQYFTFFAAHDAGVYQHVGGLAAGDQLSFSVYAYIWASSGDDPNASDGSGTLSVQVGIDPTGGTDAASSAITWSNPIAFVDQYVQHSITATAAGESVTVFVRSSVSKVAMNNVIYLDDAELTVTGTEGVVPAATQAAETTQPAVVEVPTGAATAELSPDELATIAAATAEMTAAVETTPVVEATAAATAAPTEVPATAAATEIPATAAPTEIPATAAPSATLDTATFPFMVEYTVVRGDTVGNLATRFGSTVEAIIIANSLASDARIYETQKLMIPVKALPSPTVPATATLPPAPSATAMPTEAPVVVQPAASQTPIVVQPANPQAAVSTTYVVRYGDTLSAIASRFGVSTRALARANNIANPNIIVIGQVLMIPGPAYATPFPTSTPRGSMSVPPAGHLYQVMPGDSLYRISARFNVSVAELIQVNGIKDASHLFVGQMLIIP